jgi:hypothetical protein
LISFLCLLYVVCNPSNSNVLMFMAQNFIAYVKKFFTFCLYFGKRKNVDKVQAKKTSPNLRLNGTDGPLNAGASFVRHNGRTILVVMKDLGDVPSWIEYDTALGQFSIVQNGGSVAYLKLFLQNEDQIAVKEDSRILLVTKVQEQQIMHHLQFVVR